MNEARYFLPHLLALSTSSPFWQGRDTGLKSYRTTVFRRFPRSGIPDQFDSWSEYEEYVDTLVELHCIDDGKKVWWDLRPHPIFGTLEFRICDVPTSPRVDDRARGARAGASSSSSTGCASSNLGFRHLSARAGRGEQVARRALRHRRHADRLRQARAKCRCASWRSSCSSSWTTWSTSWAAGKELEYVRTILAEGTSADRQLQVYKRDGRSARGRPLAGRRNARAGQSAARRVSQTA